MAKCGYIDDLHHANLDAEARGQCAADAAPQATHETLEEARQHATVRFASRSQQSNLMSYAERWLALAARIKGLQNSGELYALFQSYRREDNYGAGKFLREQCGLVVFELEFFRKDFFQSLPSEAIARIDNFLNSRLAQAAKDTGTEHRGARGALVALAAVEAEITYILSGRQELIRARSERAFLLLQRLLAVDRTASAEWLAALNEGETACERLGSVLLLSQGIYAFKANAAGARTDLVFAEAPDESLLVRSVEGLVLTEWKVATRQNAVTKFAEARLQAEKYKRGALAGIELTGYRYLVAVSLKELPSTCIPGDSASKEGIVYRHINIAVQPDLPSIAARKRH